MSKNNIFITDKEPVKRYMKAMPITYTITGWRLDPETGKKIDFLLSCPGLPLTAKYEDLTKRTFSYDDDVVELYSDKEVRMFVQMNKYLFQKGLIQEFEGEPDEVDTSNVLSDKEVMAIALMTPAKLTARLEEIDSEITVKRILATAEEIGRPAKVLALLRGKLSTLEHKE